MATSIGIEQCDTCKSSDRNCYRVGDLLQLSVTSKVYSGGKYCRSCIEKDAPKCRNVDRCAAAASIGGSREIGRCFLTRVPYEGAQLQMTEYCPSCYTG